MLHMRFFFQWIIDFAGGGTTEIVLVSTATLGFVLFLFRFFDAITDPLAGILSDRVVAKGGRRSVILLWSAPFLSLGLILSFSLSQGYSTTMNWMLLLIAFVLFFSAYTLYGIPYWSLISDFGGRDEGVKSKLSSLLGQGLFVATAIGFVVTPLMIESFGYFYSALIIAFIGFPLLLLPVYAGFEITTETQKNDTQINFSVAAMISSFVDPLREKSFMAVLLYFIGSQMAFTILTATSSLYVVQILNQPRSYVSVVMGPVILLAIITFIFLPRYMKKYHWSTLLHYASIALGVVFILSGLISFGETIPLKYQAVALFALIGPLIAIVLGVEGFAIVESGREKNRTGMYFGAFNFMIKGMNGVALWGAGVASERVLADGDAFSLRALLFSAGLLVIVLSLISIQMIKNDRMKKVGDEQP